MKYYGPRLIHQEDLPSHGHALAVPEGEIDDFYVMDMDGDALFRVPDGLADLDWNELDRDKWLAILEGIAVMIERHEAEAYEIGVAWGKEQQIKAVHALLGIDQIERIADALEEFVGRT